MLGGGAEKGSAIVPQVLVSTGDPAGIGPEICMKALKILGPEWAGRIFPVGDFDSLSEAARLAGYREPLQKVSGLPKEKASVSEPCRIFHVPLRQSPPRGIPSAPAGRHAYDILKTCVRLCMEHPNLALVTCPIHKESMKQAGYGPRGHTELLADLAGVERVETVFCVGDLKIFFLTRHLSLREAIERVKKERIRQAVLRMERSMKDLGYERPRLAVAGLNPHGGEGGLFGREEIDEILPAVAEARKLGVNVEGPFPADSVFHLGLEGRFDAVLSLFHDQGHIAAKTRAFFQTVTISLGLPFVRTSVDHGTGMDIAWKGLANPESLVRAIELAANLARKKA
jgi:4-hydroxythreonine-4-phosphate dehydrogenase